MDCCLPNGFQQTQTVVNHGTNIIISSFGPDAQFILETDASLFGLGAVLAQKKEDGHVYPVAFASRTLNPQEKNYGITEMETLAVV